MSRTTLLYNVGLACLAALVISPKLAHGVTFQEIARFDVAASAESAGSSYIGNNPSAVAWSGSQLYIAGFNSSGAAADTAIVEITNSGATGLNAATFGSPFGVLTTPNLRGYSGMDLERGVLAAAYDDGAADPNGIQAFDASNNTQTWAKNARGGSSAAHDPGFGGVDSGIAWLTFGSGRRSLQDTATGADIYTTGDGMIITDFGESFWRDLDFDQSTGDVYMRRSNDLLKATRTGGNSVTVSMLVDNSSNGSFVAGQNVDFMATHLFGDVVIYNDRPATGTASFADVVKLIDSSGTPLSATFSLIGGGIPDDGVGYYDFDFDPSSQTLALLDFNNRNVHIFQVVPEPSTFVFAIAGTAVLFGLRRWR